jgi:hypothetical protein
MSHYVWQMNDGRWHISRQTNSAYPLLPCAWEGGFDTEKAARARLRSQEQDGRLVVTTDEQGQPAYYTGRCGKEWLSPIRSDAFVYLTDEGATVKATAFNDLMAPMHFGIQAFRSS